MKTFLDVLDLLKKFDIYIHVGKRLWDIELAAIEVDNLYRAGILKPKEYAQIKLVLRHEHEAEERHEQEREN
ncbi:YqgQ family protein [Weissella minor]|uniref:YqgQ family protein n=1 Tax=Weissella minor TaxID=1620 RepID=UPI001BAEEE6A|nr:YqgQ family protein [Weissella minor]MBS0949489.1 YqgQ family protein [Weissella minor]